MAETPGPGDDSDMEIPQQHQLGFSPASVARVVPFTASSRG